MKYQPTKLPTLERKTGKFGRVYVTEDGIELPSVTTVLSHKPNKDLDNWKASVGEEEAKRIAARAAHRGTYIHALCEAHIKGTQKPPRDVFNYDMWVSFKPLVEKIEEVYALEAPLYSKFLGAAGTVDCVGLWNNRLSIIDFKTSSRVKSAEDIPSYFMQCAAYAVMWEELTKKPITQLVVLMAVEDESPIVFVEHRDNWVKEFMQLRKQYKETFGL